MISFPKPRAEFRPKSKRLPKEKLMTIAAGFPCYGLVLCADTQETITGYAIVGTVEEYPTQAHALRAAEHMRFAANPDNPNGRLISFGELIDRYMPAEVPHRFS